MKNLQFILPLFLMLMSWTTGNSQAQVAMNDSRFASDGELGVMSRHETSNATVVNQKAETNFKKDYSLAKEAQWSVFADQSMVCRFYLKNVLHRAFYTPHGHWMYTISGYGGSELDKAIAERIKMVYYNFRIVYADQVDLVNGKTFYIVEIQDEKSIRKIRVNEDAMEVVLQFAKP
jgi:hypothetical protein